MDIERLLSFTLKPKYTPDENLYKLNEHYALQNLPLVKIMVFPPTQKIQFFMINLCKEVNFVQFFMINLCKEVNKEAFFFKKGEIPSAN